MVVRQVDSVRESGIGTTVLAIYGRLRSFAAVNAASIVKSKRIYEAALRGPGVLGCLG